MRALANAPDPTAESISDELHGLPDAIDQDGDLPLWYGALILKTAEARASRVRAGRPSTLPWRAVVSRWPLSLRQRWGDRANQLQDHGLDWKEAERSAFDELKPAVRPVAGDPGGRD